MATIKSYTDINQSKKLAEILPLESADMYFEEVCNLPKVIVGNYILHNQCMEDKDYKKTSNPVLSPAWSLSALLDVLPFPMLYMEMVAGMILWRCECHFIETGEVVKIEHYDNSIDACVAMVEKLNELKLL